MTGGQKLYTCIYCGDTLPFDALWFMDNRNNTGICYKKTCKEKHAKDVEHEFGFVDINESWNDLFNQEERG